MNDAPIQHSGPARCSEMRVDPILLQTILSIQEAFVEVSETLAQSLIPKPKGKKVDSISSGSSSADKADPLPSIQTTEQLDKAFAAILKPQLQASLKTLFNAVKPLSDNRYTAVPRRSSDTDVLTARSDAEWLQSIDHKLEVLTSMKSTAPNHKQQLPQPPFHHEHSYNVPSQPPPHHRPLPISPPILPPAEHPATPPFKSRHVDSVIPNFISSDSRDELKKFLDNESFVMEGGRGCIQYGDKYKYMGSKCDNVKPVPAILKTILDHVNSNVSYELNSILVNKYEGIDSFLPEHSDDELSIDPQSSIHTISIGDTRKVLFRNVYTGEEHEVDAANGSQYTMSRESQAFYKHRIEKDLEFSGKVRYSITIRAVHWRFLNSTILIGDSNTKPIIFGEGKGKIGNSTPGRRLEALHIQDIDPASCAPYKNVVLMVGTNNLKDKKMNSTEIQDLVNTYREKLLQIRLINPLCKLFLVPVIPSKSDITNRNIGHFNNLVVHELVQHFSKLFIVWGTGEFTDNDTGRLANRFHKSPDPCGLHLNRFGTSRLVVMIKQSIFQAKDIGSRIHNSRSFANVTGTGTSPPVHR